MFDFKGRVEGIFSNFAEAYDDIWEKRMPVYTELLIRDLQIPENPTVLDVGCGTGLSTFTLIKRVQGKGKFYGIDISEKMINLAMAKAVDLGYSNVEFRGGDAEQLDFPESSFDLIVSNQTFLWLPNKQKALNEMFRALKPMGQAALLFFGEQTAREEEEIYNKIRNRHPEHALPESSARTLLIGLEETHELFDRAGFKKTRIYGIHEIGYRDPSKYYASIAAGVADFWRINMPPELVDMVAKEISEEMTKAKTDKGFKTTIYNIIAYAQKT